MKIGGIVALFNHATHQAQRITRQQSIKAIQQKYPDLYRALKNLTTNIANNPQILFALEKYTGLTTYQIFHYLDINSVDGPIIKLGKFVSDYGGTEQDKSLIAERLVNALESTTSGYEYAKLSFLSSVTLLHEFVHWARTLSGLPSGNGIWGNKNEYGGLFETKAFGDIVGEDNAFNTVKGLKWKF